MRPVVIVVMCAAGIFALDALLVGTDSIRASESPTIGMVGPEYTESGELVRPTEYRKWVFLGASLGLSYSNAGAPANPVFHHVYMQPEAYDYYAQTGKFPEETLLVMENYSAGTKEDNTAKGQVEGEAEFENLHGQFEDKLLGVEVALKDSSRFEEEWAYYNFSAGGGALKVKATPFPKGVCWDCHNQHAADDNVFVQFYPVLRELFQRTEQGSSTKFPE